MGKDFSREIPQRKSDFSREDRGTAKHIQKSVNKIVGSTITIAFS